MALMAWGSRPPGLGPEKLGWFKEFELAVFCQIKESYSMADGEESWQSFRRSVNAKFPGPSGKISEGSPPPAIEVLSDADLWGQSLFSVRCENYR